MMTKSKFYKSGVRFTCTECGNCCSAPDGSVYLVPEEAENIAELLDLKTIEFLDEYTLKENGTNKLILRSHINGDCIFLKDNRCTVYDARPLQCRTFPFWPEIMKSSYRWQMTSQHCPGINEGRVHLAEEIEAILKKMKAHQKIADQNED